MRSRVSYVLSLIHIFEVAPVQTEEVFEEDIFVIVEEKASFMGGDEGTFRNWVQQRVKYPAIAQENGIQGKVII